MCLDLKKIKQKIDNDFKKTNQTDMKMQWESKQVNIFEVKIVIGVVEHLFWGKMKATCDLIWFLLCIFLFSVF